MGEYKFVGYFPSIPYISHRETHNDLPVLKTKATLYATVEERFHYFDGQKYLGVLVPFTMGQYQALERKEFKMHPKYHLEYFTREVP